MGLKSQSNDNWGMGLLLVFFPETNSSSTTTTAATPSATVSILDKSSSFSNSSPSTPNSTSVAKIIKTSNSSNPILTKTQSTISICALLLFLTLLLFTLSTFEPTPPKIPRRFLPEKLPINPRRCPVSSYRNFSWFSASKNGSKDTEFPISFALQGMGKLYTRGTRAMNDLVVGHVVEDTTEDVFKLFLRLLHRSGLTAKADTVFIFDSSSSASRFQFLIKEENDSFLKLVHLYKELNRTIHDSVSAGRFDVTQFVKNVKKEMREPLWGKKIRPVNNLTDTEEIESELNRLSYGSVVGFEAAELDPENTLSGFLDHVPMSLKRWACYPMLLGRVRRNFKHIMLVDVKKLVILSDPVGQVRNHNPESVHISIKQESSSSRHGKRNREKSPQVNSAIVMGGTRGIRRFSNAMLTEIVRAAMQHKKKSMVTETGILSELAGNGHILKNIELVMSSESIPEASEWNSNGHKIIQRGNSNYDLNSVIMKQICACEIDYSVYKDCVRYRVKYDT